MISMILRAKPVWRGDIIPLHYSLDKEMESMYTALVSSKYQVVIPNEVRKQFGIKPGQRIAFIPYNHTLHVVVVPPIEQARGMLKGMNTDGYREDEDEQR